MDKKSKILLWSLFFLMAGSLFFMYYKTFVLRDYLIQSEIECDPYIETCFVSLCNSDDEECTSESIENASYYKIIRRLAKNIPSCDQTSPICSLNCGENEEGCTYELCDVSSVEEGVFCSDPEEYSRMNPSDDEVLDIEQKNASGVIDDQIMDASTEDTSNVINLEDSNE